MNQINVLDWAGAAAQEIKDKELCITWFEIPKVIRDAMLESLRLRDDSFRNAMSFGIFGGCHWSYNDVDMFACEYLVEDYLKSCGRPTDTGASIFLNKHQMKSMMELFEELPEGEEKIDWLYQNGEK